MLSMIERGQTNPTLATVWALAQALNVELSEMIGVQSPSRQVRIDVASPAFTPEIRNDDGLCVLRILSPADRVDSLEWYELRFEPQGALVSAAHGRGTREHLTVLEGELRVQAGDETSLVTTGATARYPADVSHEIRNTGDRPARAILVVVA
jgi:quercetin dioxygenase-like cupin family protein